MFSTFIFASTATVAELNDPLSIVEAITPLLIMLATALVKKISPSIPSWVIPTFIVTGLSALITYLNNLLGDPSLPWLAQFIYGLLAVFLHQVSKQVETAAKSKKTDNT